jgi:protein gp37
MADKTGIEWTDATWNPTTGCDRVSPGCDHCYAMTLAPRLKAMGSAKYQTDGDPRTSGPGFGYAEHEGALDQPLRWTRPRRIFVNSMSDLFHGDATREFQAKVWAVMALAPQHTFQVLTKRPGIMRSVLSSESWRADVERNVAWQSEQVVPWPLPNVWVGTSVESQPWARRRIPALLDTPAAVRFLSCEPLLGPVDLTEPLATWAAGREVQVNQHLHWVIAGGESGPGARPMDLDWARGLRDQCGDARVAFHYKQQGSGDGGPKSRRTLDGRTWDEFPETTGG